MSPNFRLDQMLKRVRIWYAVLLLIFLVFGLRLFYIQIIRYDHYHQAALNDQLKQYQIPATRGLIEAHEAGSVVPIVLNQKLYTLYADPTLVKKPGNDAKVIANILGGSASTYEQLLKTTGTRYVVLAKKITEAQSNKVLAAKMPGVGTVGQDYRTYPDGSLAAQVLGFVNDNGQGEYGIEQALNKQLSGQPGMLKAITDASGMPLVATPGNIDKQPVAGKNVVLTLNMGLQAQIEQILQEEYKATNSHGLSAIVMNPSNGAIVAMDNYPSYNPAAYSNVSDYSVFENRAVSYQMEPGSIMKVLTTAAALNQGDIQENTTYYDPGYVTVDGFKISEVDFPPSHTVSIGTVLRYSLNTGAVYILKQMGGGSLDAAGRQVWYNYMVHHFLLGQPTGIEQPNEASGLVPIPNNPNDPSINLTYANTSFGQGVSVTLLQMAGAYSAVLNGGTYYQPHLLEGYVGSNGNENKLPAKVLAKNVIKPQVAPEIERLMEYVYTSNHVIYRSDMHPGYIVGGKTGTAQIAVNGAYSKTRFNGTFMGFVGVNKPQYVVAIFNKDPNLPVYEFGGAEGSAPVFGKIVDTLINDGYVTPGD